MTLEQEAGQLTASCCNAFGIKYSNVAGVLCDSWANETFSSFLFAWTKEVQCVRCICVQRGADAFIVFLWHLVAVRCLLSVNQGIFLLLNCGDGTYHGHLPPQQRYTESSCGEGLLPQMVVVCTSSATLITLCAGLCTFCGQPLCTCASYF